MMILRPLSYKDANVFLLCFDVHNRKSLDNIVTRWLPEARRHCPREPAVLVANKIGTTILSSLSVCPNCQEIDALLCYCFTLWSENKMVLSVPAFVHA